MLFSKGEIEMRKQRKEVDESLLITERIPGYNILDFPKNIVVDSSTIIGNREKQEDFLNFMSKETTDELGQLCKKESLFVVCDGMGGLSNGEIASREAANGLIRDFYKESPIMDIKSFLKKEIFSLNEKVNNFCKENQTQKCGTTIAAAYIENNQMSWGSVGDSKVYLYRNGNILPLTREHNYKLLLAQSLADGSINKEEYEREMKHGNALISYLGIEKLEIMDISRFPILLQKHDWIVLCSDGISKIFTDEQIGNILDVCKECPEKAADILTQTAIDYGNGQNDNCSVITIYYTEEERK